MLPDLFDGDQVSIGDYDAKKVDIPAWISRHTVDDVAPIVEATIKHLRGDLHVPNIAAAGYCFGGKVCLLFILVSVTLDGFERTALNSSYFVYIQYVVQYLKAGQLDSGYIAHPSFVTKEELCAIQRPLSITAAGTMPPTLCAITMLGMPS